MHSSLQQRTHHIFTEIATTPLNHHKISMWVLDKIRESMENIPLELNHYRGKSEEDLLFSSKTSFSQSLHSNIITPDNIPEFCLPPRLCKRSTLPEAEKTQPSLNCQKQLQKSCMSSNATQAEMKYVKAKKDDSSESWKVTKKPLPFSAAGYGMVGLYESPNTRRKESLLLSKSPVYMFERRIPKTASSQAKEISPPKKTFSGFLPLFSCKNFPEAGKTESETPSSSDSPPFSSFYKSPKCIPSRSGCLKQTKSCPSLIDIKGNSGSSKKVGLSLTHSPFSPLTLEETSYTLTPPVLPPLDILQCQERLQHEHLLPLKERGNIRLSAEQTTLSNNCSVTLYTVRVRLVSVEGLSDETDRRSLNCAVILCLMPGKLQQQESATIRNCRSPVFNEDFFFIELSHEDLMELQIRLKVVNKPSAGTLRRGAVIGTISKPLKQILPLKKQA